MRRLFVSYARENKPDVEKIVRHLAALDYQTWFDSSLRGGQSWWEEILRRIADCDVFVAIVSRDSLDSVACKRELEWALALNRPVLPVAVEHLPEALPRHFSMRQIVDYSQPGQDAAFALVGALASLPPAPAPPPAELPEPPPPPLSYLTDLIDQVSQPGPLTHAQQRQILIQLQPALRSADSEERKGSHYILETFSKREDLYADIDRMLNGVRQPEGQDSAAPSPFISEEAVTRRDAAPPSENAPVQEPIPAQAATDYQKPYSTHAAYPLPPSIPTQRQRRGIPTFVLALVAVIVVAAGGIGAWFLLRDSGGTQGAIGAVEGQPIPVGKKPWDIEKGDGFFWTTNTDETTISKVDPATDTAKQIEVGGDPWELAVTPGYVWVWNYIHGITRVDIESSKVDFIPVVGVGDIAGIAAGGGYVWLSHTDNTVTRINAETGTRTGDPIPVGKEPRSSVRQRLPLRRQLGGPHDQRDRQYWHRAWSPEIG